MVTDKCVTDWSAQMEQLREVHIEGDDRHGDLPPFEDFWVDFSDDTDGLARDENTTGAAFEERGMLDRLQAVFLPKVVTQHIKTRMDFQSTIGVLSSNISLLQAARAGNGQSGLLRGSIRNASADHERLSEDPVEGRDLTNNV